MGRRPPRGRVRNHQSPGAAVVGCTVGCRRGPRTRAGHARCLAGRVRSYERSDEIQRQVRKEVAARERQSTTEVDSQVVEAQRLVSRELALLAGDGAQADWLAMGNAERLNALTRLSLTKTFEILSLWPEPGDFRLLALQKDLAMAVISKQIRVDETQLKRPRDGGRIIAELIQRIEAEDAAARDDAH